MLLDADAARERLDADGTLAATFTPDCAALHPLRLVRGLAASLDDRGVSACSSTPVRPGSRRGA